MPVSSLTKAKFGCLVYQWFIIIASDMGHQIFTDFVDYKHTIKRFYPCTLGLSLVVFISTWQIVFRLSHDVSNCKIWLPIKQWAVFTSLRVLVLLCLTRTFEYPRTIISYQDNVTAIYSMSRAIRLNFNCI